MTIKYLSYGANAFWGKLNLRVAPVSQGKVARSLIGRALKSKNRNRINDCTQVYKNTNKITGSLEIQLGGLCDQKVKRYM